MTRTSFALRAKVPNFLDRRHKPETTMTLPSPALDLPLVAKELKLTFDVVERSTGKAKRITLLANVGVPFDEDGAARDDGSFDVHDLDGRSRLEYVRMGDVAYVLRMGLDRWQKPTTRLSAELDVLHGASECSYVMERTPLHGITGRPVKSWSTSVEGRPGDAALDRIYDTSAIPDRLRMLRETLAAGVLLTPRGLAYRSPFPSWSVQAKGAVVALTRPTRSSGSSNRFGYGRLDDALEMARRLGRDPEVRGGVVAAPAGAPVDRSKADAAVWMAGLLVSALSQDLCEMPGQAARLWHDCANARSIVDQDGDDGAARIMIAARDLARTRAGTPGMALCWRWGAGEETRIGLEVGDAASADLRAGPTP